MSTIVTHTTNTCKHPLVTSSQAIPIFSFTSLLLVSARLATPGLVFAHRATSLGLQLYTTPRALRALAVFLRNSSLYQLQTLVDIAVIDNPSARGRFSINYLFLSHRYNQRLSVTLFGMEVGSIPSLASPFFQGQKVFASAG